MVLTILFLLLSIAISGTIYYFTHLYETWYYFFVPILLIPILYIVLFILYVIVVWCISLLLNKKKKITGLNQFYIFWIKQTIAQLFIVSRTRIKVEGKEQLDPNKRYLIVSNNISTFDPMVVIYKLGINPLACVSKIENLSFPICGPFIHHAGYLFLDRNDAHSAVQMVKTATEYLNKNWASIYICPEGTRSKTGNLLPFHAGSFKIATRAEVDIVVCSIKNTNQIAKRFPWRGTKVNLKVLGVLPKEEVIQKNTTELATIAQQMIQEEMER